jgi:hypothetical protein
VHEEDDGCFDLIRALFAALVVAFENWDVLIVEPRG